MNKNETLKLALEALEEIALAGMSGTGQESYEAMTAWQARQAWKFIGIAARALEPIKQARALDKMAENARELGLDYEPAPVQPVAWLYPEGLEALKAGKCWTAYGTKQDDNCNIPVHLNAAVAPKVEPVKTECDGFDSHPAAQPAPVQELQRYSPNGEGGMEVDSLGAYVKLQNVTTPPAAPDLQAELDATNRQVEILSDALAESRREVAALKAVQEPVAWIEHHKGGDNLEWDNPGGKCTPLYTTPPAQPAPVRPTKDVEISNMGKPFTVKAYATPQPAPEQQQKLERK